MKLLIVFLTMISSFIAHAQVKYLTPSGLNASVESVNFINLRSDEVPYDESSKRTYLISAEVEIKIKITDNGCHLNDKSPILVNYKADDMFSRTTEREHFIELYLEKNSSDSVICAGWGDEVTRFESLRFQVVNGVGATASDDVTHTYVINSNAGWGAEPVKVKVLVNQEKQIIEKL